MDNILIMAVASVAHNGENWECSLLDYLEFGMKGDATCVVVRDGFAYIRASLGVKRGQIRLDKCPTCGK